MSDNTRFVANTVVDVLAGLREIADLAHGADGADGADGAHGADGADGAHSADGADGDVASLRARLCAVLDRLDLGFVADEVPSALSQSLEGLERVGGIVRAMKDFSHPGHGRGEVDLNRVVETTTQVTRNEWKYLAALDLDLDRHLGAVPCFEGEIKQVLLNLVVNAAQAIAERRRRVGDQAMGRIVVRTARQGPDAVIAVSDDGIGMDEQVRQRAFDPFFTTKPVGQGTGQGLSLAHDIVVRRHGGRIEITSEPGLGTTFTVYLPTAVPAQVLSAEDDSRVPGTTPAAGPRGEAS